LPWLFGRKRKPEPRKRKPSKPVERKEPVKPYKPPVEKFKGLEYWGQILRAGGTPEQRRTRLERALRNLENSNFPPEQKPAMEAELRKLVQQ